MSTGSHVLEREVQVMLAIAEAMNASSSQQAILTDVLDVIVSNMSYRAALIRLLNAETGTLELAASVGLSQDYLHKGDVTLAASGLDQRVFAGEVVVLAEAGTEGALQYPHDVVREGIRSILAVPLRRSGKVVGVLRVMTGEPYEFPVQEQAFLSGVANLVARAIANISLYESFRNIAKQVNSSLEVPLVLRNVLRSLIEELNVKAGSVRLIGPKRTRLHLAAAEGLSETYVQKGVVYIAESPIDQKVLTDNKAVMIYDVATEVGFQYPAEATREGIRSVLAVPLRVREDIVGVLRVYSAQPHRFGPEEIALVEAVADLGGIALDNARLHEALSQKYEAARTDWAGWFRYLTFS